MSLSYFCIANHGLVLCLMFNACDSDGDIYILGNISIFSLYFQYFNVFKTSHQPPSKNKLFTKRFQKKVCI